MDSLTNNILLISPPKPT